MAQLEFAGQNKGEEVVFAIKQHVWYFASSFLKALDLWLFFLIIFHFFWASGPASYAFYIVLVWSIYILSSAWFCWTNTIYLLTNQRVVAVDQKSWFSRIISEASLGNILFISHKVQGPINTILNFGSIHIRASGVIEEEMVLANVADPYELQQKIVSNQKNITGRMASEYKEEEYKDFWKNKNTIPKNKNLKPD